jgi:hypothetical protein
MRRRVLPFIAVAAVAASALTGCTTAASSESCIADLQPGALSQSVRVSGSSNTDLSVKFSELTSPANPQRSVVQQADTVSTGPAKTVEEGMIVKANFAFVDLATGEVLQASDTYGTEQGGLSIADPEAGPIFGALQCATVGETTATVISEEDSAAMGAPSQLLLITQILDAVPTRAEGASKALPTGFPAVTNDSTGRPGIVLPPQQAPSKVKSAARILGTGEKVTAEQGVVGHVLTVSWDGQQVKNSWESLPEGFGNEEMSAQTGATFRAALTGYPVGSQVVVIEPGDGQPTVSVIDILAVL